MRWKIPYIFPLFRLYTSEPGGGAQRRQSFCTEIHSRLTGDINWASAASSSLVSSPSLRRRLISGPPLRKKETVACVRVCVRVCVCARIFGHAAFFFICARF